MLGDLTFFQRFFLSVGGGEAQQLKIRLGQMIAGYRLMDCGQKQWAKAKEAISASKSECGGSIKLSPTGKQTPTEFPGQRKQQHSPHSLSPPLTRRKPSPTKGLGPGESTL